MFGFGTNKPGAIGRLLIFTGVCGGGFSKTYNRWQNNTFLHSPFLPSPWREWFCKGAACRQPERRSAAVRYFTSAATFFDNVPLSPKALFLVTSAALAHNEPPNPFKPKK